MKSFIQLLITGTLLSSTVLFSAAQTFESQKLDIAEIKRKAKAEFANEHYHNAADLLIQVVQAEPNDAWTHYELGISYLHTNSFEEALLHIKRAYEIDPKHGVDKAYHYWLGRAYHQNHDFEEAVKEYNIYENSFGENDNRREEVELLKAQANVGVEEYANPKNLVVLNMGSKINSPFDDHTPILADSGQTVYFTSKKHYQGHDEQSDQGEYYETIFKTSRNERGVWSNPNVAGGVLVEHNGHHDACIQIYDQGNKMLMYRDEEKGNIYIVEKDELGNWTKMEPIEAINSKKAEDDATISADGNTIIFSREASGLHRYDLDLFITKKINGVWSEPVLLNDKINSKYDEISPFLSADGTSLYFASNNEKSMGGFDIFKSIITPDGKDWSEPKNLGFPINTVYHDLYYQENETQTMATLSSHREGGQGELDIYAMYPVQLVEIDGKIDTRVMEGKEDVHVYLNSQKSKTELPFSADLEVNPDGSFHQKVVSSNTYDIIITSGDSVINKEPLTVAKTMEKGTHQSYSYNSREFIIADSLEAVALANISDENPVAINKLKGNEKLPEKGVKMTATTDDIIALLEKGFGVSLVLFDFNKTELSEKSMNILNRLAKELKEKPTIEVTLIGHTDNVGPDDYNVKLSQERARKAAEYISSKGIDIKRVKSVGKGEKAPLVSNDTEEGRARNRRVEMVFNK